MSDDIRYDNGSGAPLPQWAQGESNVLPQDVATVIYPADVRLTDGQHEGLKSTDDDAQGGEFNPSPTLLSVAKPPAVEEDPEPPASDPTPDPAA